jgi:hypothetical protein
MRMTAQDVRVWGSGDIFTSSGVFGSSAGLDLHEAWVRIFLGDKSSLTIGRQVLSYDNQRLIAKRNWNQYGLSYDAFLLKHENEKWSVDLGLSYNTMMNLSTGKPSFDNAMFNADNIIKTFNFIRVGRSINEYLNASALVIASGYTNPAYPDAIFMTGTYGITSRFRSERIQILADFYYQNGKAQTARQVEAFALGMKPTLLLDRIELGVGIDYLSGDNAEQTDYNEKERTFNKFYGSVYRYHGWMNYYAYIKENTGNGGLRDLYPFITWSINPRHRLEGKVHFFSLANSIRVEGMLVTDRSMGTEIDSRYTWNALPELTLNAGISYYRTTRTFVDVFSGPDSSIRPPYWFWIMLTFSPDIIE